MKSSVAFKLLLLLAVGTSAIVPVQRLLERRRNAPAYPLPAPAVEPAKEKAAPEPSADAQTGGAASADAPAAAAPAVPPPIPAETKSAAPSAKTDAVPHAAPGRRTYVVKEGDSLWSIAEKELGNGKWSNKILDANRGLLDPSSLRVGQVIVIPDVNADAPRHR